MSHFSKVSQANIVSKESFIAACRELGYTDITENGKIRGWRGMTQDVDVAVKIPSYEYDIGIKKDGAKYELIAESMFDRAKLGRIIQITTKHTLISEYRRKGFVARVTEDAKQNLVVTLSR